MVGVIQQTIRWIATAGVIFVLTAPGAAAISVQDSINGGGGHPTICQQFAALHAQDPTNYPNPPAGCALNGDQTERQLIAYDHNGNPISEKSYLYTFINVFVYISATIAVIFLMVGAVRYITATGDASRIQQSKDTVLYAIIGLIVAILARPIADFVIKRVSG
jgi:hypothetical protein